MRFLALWIALFVWPIVLAAQESIVADLSQTQVAITTNFTGSEILVFGAVKRDSPRTSLEPLDVIVTIAGPDQEVVVRRKDRWGPIWVNRTQQVIDSAPSFYAVLTTAPMNEILSGTEDLRHSISKAQVIRTVDGGDDSVNAARYVDALVRIREKAGTYQLREGDVTFMDETLFRASVDLPANLVEGDYRTDIYLVRERQVVSKYEATIAVQKVGLERFLYGLAHEQPLIYGLMSLFIAISAGWLASAAFRLIKA